jgi:hypothetical protein
MTIENPKKIHEHYTSTDRHWHSKSEPVYTGGDSLLTAQRNGWRLLNLTYEKIIQLNETRSVKLIYFQLIRGSERIVMPVLENPFVFRILKTQKMMVRPLHEATENKATTQMGVAVA